MRNLSLESKHLWEKFSHGFFLNILLKFKGVIYIPLLVNFISQEELGELAYIKSIVSLLIGVLLLNIPDSSNRIILNIENKLIQKTTINTFTNFSFLFSFSLLMLFVLTSTVFNLFDARLTLIISTMLFSAILDKLSKYIFQIFQYTKLLTLVTLITEYISLIIVCVVLYYDIYNDILVILYIHCAFLILSSFYLFKKLFKSYSFNPVIDLKLIKKVLKISLFLFPASYSMMIIQSSDFLIIKKYLELADLGIYSFSYSLAGVVSGLSMAVTFFWYSSAVYASKEQIIKLISSISKISLFALIVLILCYYFMTDIVIEIINSEYKSANNVIMILIVGFFIGVLNNIFQGIMYADGNEKLILVDTSIIALTNLLLNLIFIPKYGIKFAAFSTSFSFILLFIFRAINYSKTYLGPNNRSTYFYFITLSLISLLTITYYLWI